jgi:type I restriction enzyme M protein
LLEAGGLVVMSLITERSIIQQVGTLGLKITTTDRTLSVHATGPHKFDDGNHLMPLALQSELMRASINADSWGRYYTSNAVSSALVDAMECLTPNIIVELGVGKGSIAFEASKKWNSAKFITVDADPSVTARLGGLSNSEKHTHHVQDVLDDALAERIGLDFGTVDVGLCNPPYVRPKWRDSFGEILEQAGLSGSLSSIHDAGADLLFIAQNLRLLRQFGKLGLILPDGLITGEKYQGVRSVLLKDHLVEQVVQLPRKVFSKTEAQTYLLVLSKFGGETQSVALKTMGRDGQLSTAIHIACDEAKRRLDYRFHLAGRSESQNVSHKQLYVSIEEVTQGLVRGSLCSSQLESVGLPVFHLGDFPTHERGNKALVIPSKFTQSKRALANLPKNIKIAEKGDILIARIGRNLQDKICLVNRGRCVISDCVYALRVTPIHREAVMAYLTSADGRKAIEASSHGVGAKYLSRSDLLSLKLPI